MSIACVGDVSDSCTKVGILGVEQCNGIIQTGPKPTPVMLIFARCHPQNFGVCETAESDHHAGLCYAF